MRLANCYVFTRAVLRVPCFQAVFNCGPNHYHFQWHVPLANKLSLWSFLSCWVCIVMDGNVS